STVASKSGAVLRPASTLSIEMIGGNNRRPTGNWAGALPPRKALILLARIKWATWVLACRFHPLPEDRQDTTRAVNTTTGRVRASNQLEQSVIVLVAANRRLRPN
ncbi:TPA: hypothetical protein R7379_006037, partial [Pseudomonas aeruginosa]